MRRKGWRIGAASGVVAAAVVLTGCTADHSARTSAHQPRTGSAAKQPAGGTSGKGAGAATPLEAVRLAAAQVSKASTAHVVGRISVTDAGNGQRQTLRLVADEQWRPSLRMRYTMSGLDVMGTGTGTIHAVMTGTALYLSFPAVRSQLGKDWVEIRFSDVSKATGLNLSSMLSQARQFDPSQSLQLLSASGRIHRVGTGTVSGVPTTHYAGTVDVAAALRQLPAGATRRLARRGITEMGFKQQHVDAWIDSAGRTRRVVTSVSGSMMSMRTDLVISRYGERVSVSAPPASRTVDLHDVLAGRKA
ncbi:MAG: hypothetical protein ACJ74O_19940 [Frankiaceae bacterium]